ncbi:MAG: BNR repeat-containing protein, partial [Bacteroidaceae bacterium]|nr:BNR repeat-containing protein [Bacteroidaceae bacterium]
MRKLLLLSIILLLWITKVYSQTSYQGYPITNEGAWCWFADPRAIHYENEEGTINASYVGYIDVHGNVKAMQMNYLTGRRNEVLVRSGFQPDDHNNPTFLVLPDERVLIIYSRHTDEAAFYYRVSRLPGDITTLGEEKKIVTNHNTTYPSPFILSDDPEHFYLCWRGLSWHPTIAKFSLPDENGDVKTKWGPYQIVQSTGARPYAKYYSNGKDKLYVTYTTGHPDNEQPNWVYFNVININAQTNTEGVVTTQPTLEDIKGNKLSTISSGAFKVYKTADYKSKYPYTIVDSPSNLRDWVWQIVCDNEDRPIIAMVRINGGKSQHEYYYAKWTGSAWRLTDLADGGGKFHPSNTEYCYSGGEAIDPENPNVIYLSIPTVGDSGKSVYEIWKYTLNDAGGIVSKEQITKNSEKNNVRPYILPGSADAKMRLSWMHGDYY